MVFQEGLETTLGSIADRVGPSIVRIGGGGRGGSGFVLEPGFVITNAHNVRHEGVRLVFADGRHVEGSLAGVDVDGDLAVIAADTGSAPALEWSDAGAPGLGATVVGIAPNGSGPRVTVGHVSSVATAFRGPRGRRIAGSIEHTAPLAPGSSGSPLLDVSGRLVGINTNRLGGGFYLALPADESLRHRAQALRRGESTERPRLGVALAPAHAGRRLRRSVGLPDRDGLLVRAVEESSPAEHAGIKAGDLLVAAGERPLRDAEDLYDALGTVAGNGSLTLIVVRGVDERQVDVHFETEGGDQGPVH